jgi:hypothetical protein
MASAELLVGRPTLSLDLADPSGDDGRVCSGLERLAIAGESGITVGDYLADGG